MAAQLPSSIVALAPLDAIEQLLPILNTTCEHTERIAHTLAGLTPDEFLDLEDPNKHYLLPALVRTWDAGSLPLAQTHSLIPLRVGFCFSRHGPLHRSTQCVLVSSRAY